MLLLPSTAGYGDEDQVDFADFKDVTDAFSQLVCMLQQSLDISNNKFQVVKNSCLFRADEPLSKLIKTSQNIHDLFEVLAQNHLYCNWMEVRFLKAAVAGRPELLALIEKYMNAVYSKSLGEVWNYIPHYSVRNKYYSVLKAEYGEDPDNMTVEQLLKHNQKIANEIGVLIMEVQKGSLIIKFAVQTNKVYQAYLSFLTLSQQLRSDRVVQIGTWVIHCPHFVLQRLQNLYRKFTLCMTLLM